MRPIGPMTVLTSFPNAVWERPFAKRRFAACVKVAGLLLACVAAALLPGCATWDGHFEILGYTTRPMYDLSICSVRVPIFKNLTFFKDVEFQLTEAVIRE